LAHGRAVQELRRSATGGRIGLAPNLMPHYPSSDDPADAAAAWASDGYVNRWFLDPVLRGTYPGDQRARYEERLGPLDFIRDGDPVHDERRARFLHDHVEAVGDAIDQGVPVIGYCHWSLLDNFEWALGYGQRFGLVHVDFDTLERTVKDSGRYYARIAAGNALV